MVKREGSLRGEPWGENGSYGTGAGECNPRTILYQFPKERNDHSDQQVRCTSALYLRRSRPSDLRL